MPLVPLSWYYIPFLSSANEVSTGPTCQFQFVCVLGCISGLFFPEAFIDYKEYTKVDIDGAKNSQGREQMHSILDKLGKSFR